MPYVGWRDSVESVLAFGPAAKCHFLGAPARVTMLTISGEYQLISFTVSFVRDRLLSRRSHRDLRACAMLILSGDVQALTLGQLGDFSQHYRAPLYNMETQRSFYHLHECRKHPVSSSAANSRRSSFATSCSWQLFGKASNAVAALHSSGLLGSHLRLPPAANAILL